MPTLPARPTAPAPAPNGGAAAAAAARPIVQRMAPAANAPTVENLQPMSPEQTKLVAKLHKIRVKLLRVSRRLGQGPRNTVVAQVRSRTRSICPKGRIPQSVCRGGLTGQMS